MMQPDDVLGQESVELSVTVRQRVCLCFSLSAAAALLNSSTLHLSAPITLTNTEHNVRVVRLHRCGPFQEVEDSSSPTEQVPVIRVDDD